MGIPAIISAITDDLQLCCHIRLLRSGHRLLRICVILPQSTSKHLALSGAMSKGAQILGKLAPDARSDYPNSGLY
jgi:hypothetical protein